MDDRFRTYWKKRHDDSREFWSRIATDLNAGLTPRQIYESNKYMNPRTGKPYTREHLYWVAKQVRNKKVIDAAG